MASQARTSSSITIEFHPEEPCRKRQCIPITKEVPTVYNENQDIPRDTRVSVEKDPLTVFQTDDDILRAKWAELESLDVVRNETQPNVITEIPTLKIDTQDVPRDTRISVEKDAITALLEVDELRDQLAELELLDTFLIDESDFQFESLEELLEQC